MFLNPHVGYKTKVETDIDRFCLIFVRNFAKLDIRVKCLATAASSTGGLYCHFLSFSTRVGILIVTFELCIVIYKGWWDPGIWSW